MLTIGQVARRFGLSRSTLFGRITKSGGLKSRPLVRALRQSLEAMLKTGP